MAVDLPPGVPLFDEDGALSREFLLHRGYCCENGCRNCPYGFRRLSPAAGKAVGAESGEVTQAPPTGSEGEA